MRPISYITIVLLTTFISLLAVFQRKKEIAILRVLGKRKKDIFYNLVFTQLLVCSIGLLTGAITLMSIQYRIIPNVFKCIFLSVGLCITSVLIGSLTSALILVMKPPLRLVRIKD